MNTSFNDRFLKLPALAVGALLLISQAGCGQSDPLAISPSAIPQVTNYRPTETLHEVDPSIDYSVALGLQNYGNTCFSNAVFNLLASMPNVEDFTSHQFALFDDPNYPKGRLRTLQNLKAKLHQLFTSLAVNKKKLYSNLLLKIPECETTGNMP